jgi:hypothetical protein
VTAPLDIGNRALQVMGSRTNMSAAEFAANSSNEAIQCNLIMFQLRDELNRMAPWDCVTKWTNLTYITTIPGNPENPNAGAPLWQPGQPPPPWSYEYQYPRDCLRARKIIPQYTTQAGGVPIYPSGTATGAGQIGWTGPALKFKVGTDSFFGVTAAAPLGTGLGYAVGDYIILVQPSYTFYQNSAPVGQTPSATYYTMDAGAPAILQVTGVGAGGVVTSVSVLNQVQGETSSPSGATTTPIGGSYFSIPTNPVAQGSAISGTNPGSPSGGTGETFNLTFTSTTAPQRVILCNQEQAILCYNTQVIDPNVMDPLFQDAWIHILGARLAFQLAGDKALANILIGLTNNMIMEARKADGNEGITVNDVTPDFLRIRGDYGGPNWEFSPNGSFDWGSTYSPY